MVAVQQHLRHRKAPVFPGARVLGVFQQPVGKALVLGALVAAKHPRHQPRHRIHQRHGGRFAAGQHKIPKGDFLVHRQVQRPLIHALVMAAQQDQPVRRGQLSHLLLRQRLAPGAHVDARPRIAAGPGRLHRVHDGLGGHHHARVAAEGVIVGVSVLLRAEGPDIHRFHEKQPRLPRAPKDARGQVAVKHFRKDRQNRYFHTALPRAGFARPAPCGPPRRPASPPAA